MCTCVLGIDLLVHMGKDTFILFINKHREKRFRASLGKSPAAAVPLQLWSTGKHRAWVVRSFIFFIRNQKYEFLWEISQFQNVDSICV